MSLESMQSTLAAIEGSIGPKGPTPRQSAAIANLRRGIGRMQAYRNGTPRNHRAERQRWHKGQSSREMTFYDREEAMALLSCSGLKPEDSQWISRMLDGHRITRAQSREISRLGRIFLSG